MYTYTIGETIVDGRRENPEVCELMVARPIHTSDSESRHPKRPIRVASWAGLAACGVYLAWACPALLLSLCGFGCALLIRNLARERRRQAVEEEVLATWPGRISR